MTSMTRDKATIRMPTMEVDGQKVPFTPGETIYKVTQRLSSEVPTLCYDDRLDAFGACRLCVVEVEGIRNPVASCTTEAVDGMVVRTTTDGIEKHRKTLLELVASENPASALEVDELRGLASQELIQLAQRYDVDGTRFEGRKSGSSRSDDDNPFIVRDYDNCISCYRCVRVCAEQEGDYAISVKNRGFDTQITVEFDGLLKDSDCTFCGQCVQTCPTGALADKKAMRHADTEGELKKTRSVCPYCGVGCSVDLMSKGDKLVGIQPAKDGPANEGALCVKGQFAFDFVQHKDRLKTPLVRGDDGELHPASWDEALDRAAIGFKEALDKYGMESLYAVASGRAPHESGYLTQKFIRATTGTHQIDNCSRA
jgi:predicted molibdopterin-dependent oxidoreductase YjgC